MNPTTNESEQAIREQARLFDIATHAVIGTTISGLVVYWSTGATLLYGWSEEEAVGRDVVELTPAKIAREQAMAVMEQLRAGRSWSGAFPVRKRDGEEFMAAVRDLPVRDVHGNLVGIVGVSTPLGSDHL